MKRKGKGKPKKLVVPEDALTWCVMEQALHNPRISPEQGSALIKANLVVRAVRERVARQKVKKT